MEHYGFTLCISFFMVDLRDKRERNVDLVFRPFMHSLAASCLCPDRDRTKTLACQDNALTTWATRPGPLRFLSQELLSIFAYVKFFFLWAVWPSPLLGATEFGGAVSESGSWNLATRGSSSHARFMGPLLLIHAWGAPFCTVHKGIAFALLSSALWVFFIFYRHSLYYCPSPLWFKSTFSQSQSYF